MPKRKILESESEEVSDLSPPPADLLEPGHQQNGIMEGPLVKRRRTKQTTKPSTDEQEGKKTRERNTKVEHIQAEEVEGVSNTASRTKGRAKVKTEVKEEELVGNGEITETKIKRKRKTKEEKEAEAMPLAARTIGHKLFIGAHVSAAGG